MMAIVKRQKRPDERSGSWLQTLGITGATTAGGLIGLLLFWNFGPIMWAIVTVGLASVLMGIIARRRPR